HEFAPATLDEHGNARTLSKAYLWRAFLTNRYEQAASSRALQDFRGIRDAFSNRAGIEECRAPIFDEEQTPLPTVEELVHAGWPRRRETLARGLLAVAMRQGAADIADGRHVTREQLKEREYHHLFPDSLLKK